MAAERCPEDRSTWILRRRGHLKAGVLYFTEEL